MLTINRALKGYAGIKLTKSEWLLTFIADADILRAMGRGDDAKALETMARRYAIAIIAAGCQQ